MERDAIMSAGTLKTWSQVHAWFKRYKDCDDGSIAEGFTESITVLLAKHWSQLPALAARMEKDADFGSFVLKHIDATADVRNLKRIERNAKSKCPSAYAQLCAQFIARVHDQ